MNASTTADAHSPQARDPGIERWVENDLVRNDDGVHVVAGAPPFGYSDGRDNEQYLRRVLDEARDLGSESAELETHIVDWPTEYHLSRRRAQLLRPLTYERATPVLEVGCGCGAITRFLGETFDDVVSVEGSAERAAIARKRCRDLDTVSIVSAPVQTIRFRRPFGIVFCVGVFEYSSSFVEGDDPYAAIVDYFADSLDDDGVLVLAIENQFGLKYFASASEDHTKTRYDGIEGYPRYPGKARTFGHAALERRLAARFPSIEFLLPFPDYKVPDAVVAERLFRHVDAAPLLSAFRSRDYLKPYAPRFDERLAWRSLTENGMAPFFANSFLVVASKRPNQRRVRMDDLAVRYNRDRAEPFHTQTRIFLDTGPGDRVMLEKRALNESQPAGRFAITGYDEPWVAGRTIHAAVLERGLARDTRFELIFAPAAPWFDAVGAMSDGGTVPAERADAIWQNAVETDTGVTFIDQEWRAPARVAVETLVIRAIYRCLVDLRSYPSLAPCLRWRTTASIIRAVAMQHGIRVKDEHLRAFVAFESELTALALGRSNAAARNHVEIVLRLPQEAIRTMQRAARGVRAARFYGAKALRIARRLYHDARGVR